MFETHFKFDTFGRMLRITYPDGEIVTNVYDSGGNLASTHGDKNGYHYNYLKQLSYDRFEQRVLLEAGNSVKTAYTYDAKTRRLNTLTAGKGSGNPFQNLSYRYDNVGNVLSLKNLVDPPHANAFGGSSFQRFEYDDLYRLTTAQGVFPYNQTGAAADARGCAGVQTATAASITSTWATTRSTTSPPRPKQTPASRPETPTAWSRKRPPMISPINTTLPASTASGPTRPIISATEPIPTTPEPIGSDSIEIRTQIHAARGTPDCGDPRPLAADGRGA